MQEKVCVKCNISKTIDNFYKTPKGKHGVGSKCKDCCKEYSKNRYKNENEKVVANQKRYYENNPLAKANALLKSKFGITLEDYDKMLEKQDYRCFICETPAKDLKQRLDVDHCHKTNRVRGLLCSKCNKGLGLFKDNIESLKKAIKYLKDAYN